MNYIQPKAVASWKLDEPDQELYEASIMDNNTIVSAYGRYAHGSGSSVASWEEFLDGEMNDLIKKTMGAKTLNEMLIKLRSIT